VSKSAIFNVYTASTAVVVSQRKGDFENSNTQVVEREENNLCEIYGQWGPSTNF